MTTSRTSTWRPRGRCHACGRAWTKTTSGSSSTGSGLLLGLLLHLTFTGSGSFFRGRDGFPSIKIRVRKGFLRGFKSLFPTQGGSHFAQAPPAGFEAGASPGCSMEAVRAPFGPLLCLALRRWWCPEDWPLQGSWGCQRCRWLCWSLGPVSIDIELRNLVAMESLWRNRSPQSTVQSISLSILNFKRLLVQNSKWQWQWRVVFFRGCASHHAASGLHQPHPKPSLVGAMGLTLPLAAEKRLCFKGFVRETRGIRLSYNDKSRDGNNISKFPCHQKATWHKMLQALRAEAGPLDFFVFICWRAALLEARPLKRGIHAQHDAKSLNLFCTYNATSNSIFVWRLFFAQDLWGLVAIKLQARVAVKYNYDWLELLVSWFGWNTDCHVQDDLDCIMRSLHARTQRAWSCQVSLWARLCQADAGQAGARHLAVQSP